jgi:hypothetical protein
MPEQDQPPPTGQFHSGEAAFLGAGGQTVQTNAFRLLEIMEKETRGSSTPVFLGNLPDLGGMNEEEAKAAYHYLRGKGLIDPSNLGYAARVSAYGHDALRDAQLTPDKSTSAFPAITYNILHVETMTGSNIQQGTAHSQITATHTITTQQFVESVQKLVDQLDGVTSSLPAPAQEQTREALSELRAAVNVSAPDASRLRRGLESLRGIMEHAAGHLVAVGALDAIAKLLASLPS